MLIDKYQRTEILGIREDERYAPRTIAGNKSILREFRIHN